MSHPLMRLSRVCASLVPRPRLGMCRCNAKNIQNYAFGSAPEITLSLATSDSRYTYFCTQPGYEAQIYTLDDAKHGLHASV